MGEPDWLGDVVGGFVAGAEPPGWPALPPQPAATEAVSRRAATAIARRAIPQAHEARIIIDGANRSDE